jgi:hypothetical protein
VQRARAQPKEGNDHGAGVVGAPPIFKQARLVAFFKNRYLSFVGFNSSSEMYVNGLFPRGYGAVSELSQGVLSKGGRYLFCRAWPFRLAHSTPLISISRDLAPYDKLTLAFVIQSGFLGVQPQFICGHLRG